MWERQYVASLPPAEFQRVLAMYQDATEAELSDYPSVRTLNEVQAKGAERAHQAAMVERFRTLPAGLAKRVMGNMEAADPAEACQVGATVFNAMLDLTSRTGPGG
jgi:hypothetical protein